MVGDTPLTAAVAPTSDQPSIHTPSHPESLAQQTTAPATADHTPKTHDPSLAPPMTSPLADGTDTSENIVPQTAADTVPEDLAQQGTQQRHASEDATDSEAPKRAKNRQPRLFLDLFSGVNAPLTHAMHGKGVDHFQLFDLDKDPKCDILDNAVLAILLRMAWSGILGAVWSAPPCKEYSRLKLRPGGPKALRTPEYMDGVPGLSAAEQSRVDRSKAIHDRLQHRSTRRHGTAAQQHGMAGVREYRTPATVDSALRTCTSR